MSFEELRAKYPKFIYEDFKVEEIDNELVCTFYFNIPGLTTFEPTIKFPIEKKYDKELVEYLVFHIGLVELVSYFKCTCSPNIEIKAGYLDEYQINWFKKLYYYGLGEFMYVNKIDCSMNDLMHITCTSNRKFNFNTDYNGSGNLIAIGGGKDSIVSLELLKGYDNLCHMINPKKVSIDVCNTAGVDYYGIIRTLDKKIIELNKEGFLNGHTPFSSLVAFVSYLACYLNNKKYIVLSNEGSANEPTVLGTKINHQYSKTYEFELDFDEYTKRYFNLGIKYFSLLRPLKEIQIAMLFSKYKKYHTIFKSCNVGSKSEPWEWCCNCPKCLFVFIILRVFLSKEEMVNIFGRNVLDNKDLLNSFLELIGESDTKPFECIGTIEEVRFAMNKIIEDDDSYLSNIYREKYYKPENIDLNTLYYENNVIPEYLDVLKEAIRSEKQDNTGIKKV